MKGETSLMILVTNSNKDWRENNEIKKAEKTTGTPTFSIHIFYLSIYLSLSLSLWINRVKSETINSYSAQGS